MPVEQENPPPEVLGRIARAAVWPRPIWSSRRAYVITAISGVVGLGAIWRFPYLAGQHGGGSFVLAYLVCLVVIAVPLAAVESSAGRLARGSPVGLFRLLNKRAGPAFGWLVVSVTVLLMSYYFVISGWTLGYAADAVRNSIRPFPEFTSGYLSLWLLVAVGLMVLAVLLRGVEAIEHASRVLVPVLVMAIGTLAAYAQTLDSSGEAASFYLGVDSEHLGDGATWRAAAGQAFYQMGIGQGFLIAYGSYGPSGMNFARATAYIAAANAGVAVIAGFMIFPMVFTFDIAPDQGTQLAFAAIPRVLDSMSGGFFVGVIFFTLLFIAAFTSCIGGAAVAISAVRDETALNTRQAAFVVVAVVVGLGVPSALSFTPVALEVGGQPFLEAVDQFTGSGLIVAVGLIGSAMIAWGLPRVHLTRQMRAGRKRLGPLVLHGHWILTAARGVSLAGLIVLAWSLVP